MSTQTRGERVTALRIDDLFREHAAFVWRALKRLGVPADELDDGIQEVFLVVARRLHEYEERGSIKAWLFTIARQVALHARRAAGRREARSAQAKDLALSEASMDTGPDVDLAQKQAAALVQRMLADMDQEQALVFYLAEIESLTVPEIAASLNVNLNTAYGRLRLARKRVKAWLRENAREEGF